MMKKLFSTTRSIMTLVVMLHAFNAAAQSTDAGRPTSEQAIPEWYKAYEWSNGLELIPHQSINQQEFARQYHANSAWWDKTFDFLKTHDLANLKPGRYIIDPGNATAFVSEAPTKEMDEINWETHANFNDLQYIISGKAKMGITSVTNPNAEVAVPYDERSDTETYVVNGGDYYDAGPGTFFIFSPEDIHRPAFKVDGYDTVKKILIKVRVP